MKSNPYYVIEFERIIFTCRLKAWLFMLIISIINQIATRYPEKAKKIIKGAMYKEVESVMSNAEFEEHFSPPYNVGKKFLHGIANQCYFDITFFTNISDLHV